MFPTFNQFSRWAAAYRAIPLWMEPELPRRELLEWVHSLHGSARHVFLLHSAGGGRYSYAALDGPRYLAEADHDSLRLRHCAESGARQEVIKIGNPYERFHGWFSRMTGPRVEALPPFWGGAVGFLGYESASHLESKWADLFRSRGPKAAPLATERFPLFEFGVYDAVAAVDHARGRLWLVHTVFLPEGRVLSPVQLERLYRQGQDRLRRYAVQVQKAVHHRKNWGVFRAAEVRSNRSEAAFRLMVRRAKGFIAAGDIYQCNLTQSFSATWSGDPWVLYRDLTRINPSPYAALWRSGSRWMVSASPELLLRLEAGRVETRPIAGTYPRQLEFTNERWMSQALARDAKERAEHLMMVDVERNDLGRVCLPGTVQVSEALGQEMYSHVIHLVSDIRGTLEPGRTWLDLLRAVFPGGTITGCPKIRSTEVIHRLESQDRGPYAGSLGWVGFTGDMTLNILIGTFFLDQDRLCFPVGAGIVADSDPEREYQETLHKAEALLQALRSCPRNKSLGIEPNSAERRTS
jgi:anthranilate/para-aminobenzoate synthase component I